MDHPDLTILALALASHHLGRISSPSFLVEVAAMRGAEAAVLLAVASLSCLVLSPPTASAAAGAEVAGGAAHRNIERIASDPIPFLALSGAPGFLISLEEFPVICLIDFLRIVISNLVLVQIQLGYDFDTIILLMTPF
jgi:hypothetical protein